MNKKQDGNWNEDIERVHGRRREHADWKRKGVAGQS